MLVAKKGDRHLADAPFSRNAVAARSQSPFFAVFNANSGSPENRTQRHADISRVWTTSPRLPVSISCTRSRSGRWESNPLSRASDARRAPFPFIPKCFCQACVRPSTAYCLPHTAYSSLTRVGVEQFAHVQANLNGQHPVDAFRMHGDPPERAVSTRDEGNRSHRATDFQATPAGCDDAERGPFLWTREDGWAALQALHGCDDDPAPYAALSRVVASWPLLSPDTRRNVLAIVDANVAARGEEEPACRPRKPR